MSDAFEGTECHTGVGHRSRNTVGVYKAPIYMLLVQIVP